MLVKRYPLRKEHGLLGFDAQNFGANRHNSLAKLMIYSGQFFCILCDRAGLSKVFPQICNMNSDNGVHHLDLIR